jgi:type IV pilus assembly protein PilB
VAKRIGELMLEHQLIDQASLDEAVAEQKRSGEHLGDILIKQGHVTVEDFEYLLSRQLTTPTINLEKYKIGPEVAALIPEEFMRKNFVIPVSADEHSITVAMANPQDFRITDDLRFITGLRVASVVSSMYGIKRKLHELFPTSDKWEEAIEENEVERSLEIFSGKQTMDSREENLEEAIQSASGAPTVKFVNSVLLAALDKRATHVHFSPSSEGVEVRLRISNKLLTIAKRPREHAQNLVNRLKILGGMDIIKRRTPQEGYFRVRSEDTFYDIDVATFPVKEGEQVVLTFQQPFSKEALKLENLGMSPDVLDQYKKIISAERGIILFVGPPDSGKTSSIYATLNKLKNPERATVTYENPIKNKLLDITQAAPNERAGMSYSGGLKALLKQNIDYLMIGEMTSEYVIVTAIEASLGKTFVFARMTYTHTAGTIPRILDQGVPPFMLYSSLTAIIGQRLVRRLCSSCMEAFEPPETIAEELKAATGKAKPRLYRATGCAKCSMTGYKGRIGIFEFLLPDAEIRDLILKRASQLEIEDHLNKTGHRTLIQDGLMKAVEGLTTYEEVKTIK